MWRVAVNHRCLGNHKINPLPTDHQSAALPLRLLANETVDDWTVCEGRFQRTELIQTRRRFQMGNWSAEEEDQLQRGVYQSRNSYVTLDHSLGDIGLSLSEKRSAKAIAMRDLGRLPIFYHEYSADELWRIERYTNEWDLEIDATTVRLSFRITVLRSDLERIFRSRPSMMITPQQELQFLQEYVQERIQNRLEWMRSVGADWKKARQRIQQLWDMGVTAGPEVSGFHKKMKKYNRMGCKTAKRLIELRHHMATLLRASKPGPDPGLD